LIRSIKRTFPGATSTNRPWMLERFKGESFVAMMQTVIVQLALQIVIQKKLPLRLGLGLLVPNESCLPHVRGSVRILVSTKYYHFVSML
jgi:hypothetical protein